MTGEEAAARVLAALDAAARALLGPVNAALRGWLTRVRTAVLDDPGGLPRLDAYPTADEWAQLTAPLADQLGGVYAAAWDAAMADLIPGPDHDAVVAAREPAIAAHVADMPNRLRGVPDEVYAVLRAQLAEGVANGATAQEMRDQVADTLDLQTAYPTQWEWRAARIARTEATLAVNGGEYTQWTARRAATGGRLRLRKQWVATGDYRVRPEHARANGQVTEWDAHFSVGGWPMAHPGDPEAPPGLVVNCLPGDVRVQATGLRAATRRWFEGDVLRLRFASGNELTITPNHPVLRGDGAWVRADQLVEGDYGLRCELVGQLAIQPDEDGRPAQIGQVYRAAQEACPPQRVALAPPDLHGQGAHGEVEVVSVDGLLALHGQAASEQQVVQLGFALADLAAAGLGGDHDPRVPFGAAAGVGLAAPAGPVGFPRQGAALGGGQLAHAHPVGRADVAQLHARGAQPALDQGPADAEGPGQGQHAFASAVALDQLLHIDRDAFAGHVYDLDTGSGWYTANGMAVRNCRCTFVALPDDAEPLPLYPIGEDEDDTGPAVLAAAGGNTMPSTLEPSTHTRPVPLPADYVPAASMRLQAPPAPPGRRPAPAPAVTAAGTTAPPADAPADTPAAPAAPAALPNGWAGVLVPLDVPSGDQRQVRTPPTLRARPLPLPLLGQEALSQLGHDGAVSAGRIDRLWVENGAVMGEGSFDLASEEGAAWARRVADGYASGVSVDLDDVAFSEHFFDAAGNELDPETAIDLMWEDAAAAADIRYEMWLDDWRLMGATIVYQPAFYQAQIAPVYDYQPQAADPWPAERAATPAEPAAAADEEPESLAAAAVLLAAGVPAGPDQPPAAWFDQPTLTGPTPLTVDDDGRVYGHLATWGSCHIAWEDVCTTPPRSPSNYALFHTGELLTREGQRLAVGRLTVGGGHADPHCPYPGAIEHYDNTGAVVAVVRAYEDDHGIVLAGALHPAATERQVADLMLSPPSGDWRRVGGALELVAALAVNTAGFPTTRPRGAAEDGRQVSLVAAGMLPAGPRRAQADHGVTRRALAALPPAGLSAVLAASLRRGRVEQLTDRVHGRAHTGRWSATRKALAALPPGPERDLALRVATRYGYPADAAGGPTDADGGR